MITDTYNEKRNIEGFGSQTNLLKSLFQQLFIHTHFFAAAATMRFDGTQYLSLFYEGVRITEAEDLSFRFRTLYKDAFIFGTRDTTSPDRLQIILGK